MNTDDTIVAIASGRGRSHLGLIRLSGPHVDRVLRETLDAPVAAAGAHSRRFRLTPALSFPALVIRAVAPRSYTGEDGAELLIPGNPQLLERVLHRLAALEGVREAHPGEFSARAFLNNKLSIQQAEGVAAVIAAGADHELAAARRLLSGDTGRDYLRIAHDLAALLALVEAGIDFADQDDVVAIAPAPLLARARALLAALCTHLGSLRGGEQASTLPTVVLAGLPNAGKSTLFNALLGRARAVASPTPGTTRDVLRETLHLSASDDSPDPLDVTLFDTAGLDDAPRSAIDSAAQSHAAAALADAAVILWCDPTGRFDPREQPKVSIHARILHIRTKADRPLPALRPETDTPTISVCAIDGHHLPELKHAIFTAAWSRAPNSANSNWGISLLPRHRRALLAAAQHLREAIALVESRAKNRALPDPELVAASLRAALDEMGDLTGRMTPDDIVGRIFATFCIGK